MKYSVSIKDEELNEDCQYYLAYNNSIEYPTSSSIEKIYYTLSKCRQLIIIDKLRFKSKYFIIPRTNENECL